MMAKLECRRVGWELKDCGLPGVFQYADEQDKSFKSTLPDHVAPMVKYFIIPKTGHMWPRIHDCVERHFPKPDLLSGIILEPNMPGYFHKDPNGMLTSIDISLHDRCLGAVLDHAHGELPLEYGSLLAYTANEMHRFNTQEAIHRVFYLNLQYHCDFGQWMKMYLQNL